jgi:hypothetical protein
MNLRLYSIALLISAFPQLVSAQASQVKFNAGDFKAIERLAPDGRTLVQVKLSKSGKAKLKKLDKV